LTFLRVDDIVSSKITTRMMLSQKQLASTRIKDLYLSSHLGRAK
jgi:hypothetical protein